MALVAPSLLSADFVNLQADIERVCATRADYLHIDVMDGMFVPNITIGFPVIKAIAAVSTLPLDVHMMVADPQRYVDEVARAGARIMTVHQEACIHLDRTLQLIRQAGMMAGVSVNPATPVSLLEDVVGMADLVLIMSVNPGFGGQKFIENSVAKIRRLRAMIDSAGSQAIIEVDGGVNAHTGRRLVDAGADMLVAGSYLFGAPSLDAAVESLKNL